MNEVPVWVRHILLIIPSINIEVLPEAEESLWDKIREITRMIGFVKILSVLCDFFSAFLGRGGGSRHLRNSNQRYSSDFCPEFLKIDREDILEFWY